MQYFGLYRGMADQSLRNPWLVVDGCGDHADQGSNRISCVLRKFRTRHATYDLASYFWKMVLSRPIRQETTGRKMFVMYWSIFKLPSIETREVLVLYSMVMQTIIQIDGPYADIECKKAKCGLLGASRHVYNYQNFACRTQTCLKRRDCAYSLSTFFVRWTRDSSFLSTALLWEAEIIVAKLPIYIAANVDALYVQKLAVL